MVPPAISPSKLKKVQVNDFPSPVMTPEKSTPPPLARKPVESVYKRRRLLNSGGLKRRHDVMLMFDQEGVVHYGGSDGNVEDLEHQNSQQKLSNCDFAPSKNLGEVNCMQQVPSQEQIGKAAHEGIPNNDPFPRVNMEGSTAFGQHFTPEARSRGNDNKYSKSRTQPRKQKYWPKINDRTKPKKVPKSKKKVKPRKNVYESGMPQTCHVADESLPGPQTPEPLDKKCSNRDGSPREDCATLVFEMISSWKRTSSRSKKNSCRRALDFSNNVKDENDSLQVSTGSVASFSEVDEAKEPIWCSFNKKLEFEDFESCIGMRKIIREHEGRKHNSKKTLVIIQDLKAATRENSLIPVVYPKRKRSSITRPRNTHEAVLNAEIVTVTSLDTTCIPFEANSCQKVLDIETKNNQPEAIVVSNAEAEVASSLYATSVQVEDLYSATLARGSHNYNQMRYEHDVAYGLVQYNSTGLEGWYSGYDETIFGMNKHTQPLQLENLALENVAFNTMQQDCWTETSISEDFFNPYRKLWNDRGAYTPCIPYVRTLDTAQMQGFDVQERQENNALIPYGGRADLAQKQELVVQEREADHALIPHREQRRKPKASVDICPNTIRVWNLLMDNDAGLEGIDEQTKEWIKDETNQLSDRIDVFISRMNLFQGDRRFSHWGGSVLDSVIGVLLTQNVTDVLSSSAFMSLAAKYPPKLRREHRRGRKKNSAFSRNENAGDFHQPQNSPPNADTESSGRESVPESSPCSSSEHRHLYLLPDLNLPPNLDSSYANLVANLVLEESGPPDCRSSPSTSSELADVDFQSCFQGVEPNSKDKDELKDISRNGGSESSKSTVDLENVNKKGKTPNYWYTMGREIAIAQAKKRGKTSKIANRNNKVMPELEDPSRKSKEKQAEMPDNPVNWDELRSTYCTCKPRSYDSLDGVDWEAVHRAPFEEVSKVIEERGMNNLITGRIKDILDRLIQDHGSLDLEWLRDVPPIKAKDYLRSIGGIGLKSVECIRLLALEHHAFPVDTNIGRIAVRLGWVPLEPLPDGILIHLLDKYPLVDKIQQYLWPRLQSLDQRKLYELHYHMITFGKVFCKKRRPNCNACPMKGECRHFASEYASEKLKLPAPNKEASASASASDEVHKRPAAPETRPTPLLLEGSLSEPWYERACEPIVELPSSPEREVEPLRDIEDLCSEKDDEIPIITLNTEAFRQNLLMEMEKRNCMQLDSILNALVSATHESASIPMKKRSGLRTEHHLYELEDDHPILAGFAKREYDDPCPYLVKIWTSGEKFNLDRMIEEQSDQTVLGTILIPCKTANEGCFPLGGTYFQTNEVFADDESTQHPIAIPTQLLWNRRRRLLYCGSSATSIFTDVDLAKITYCFWRGFICVRGFDRETREPKHLNRIFHKTSKNKREDLDE